MDETSHAVESASEPVSRRGFLGRSAKYLSVAAVGTLLYTWRIEPHWVEVVERSMPIAGLPTSMVGKRLVQVSDLHAGPVVDQAFLKASLEGIAELRPDVIVVTGDFMTCYRDESIAQAIDALQSLPAAPLGRFSVLGNHDYGHRWSHHDVAASLSRQLERIDVRMLRNETASAGELQIAGVDEFWTGPRFQPELALRDLHTDRAAVALCHNPDGADQPQWAGFQGWILAGHTHGGQCRPPFLPPPITPVENKRYTAGEFDLAPGRWMYINRGLGYSHRVRFNARPEITAFTLERA